MKIILLGLLLGMAACEPHIPDPHVVDPDPVDTNYAKLVWKHAIMPDTANVSNCMPIVFSQQVGLIHMFGGPHDLLTFRDALTGEKKWSWENPSLFSGGDVVNYFEPYICDNKLLMSGWSNMAALDLNTGLSQWAFRTCELGDYCGTVWRGLVGSIVYLSVYDCHSSKKDRRMYRSSIDEPQWEFLYENNRTDGYRGSLMPPSLYINPKGDSLLIFQDRVFTTEGGSIDNRVDLMSFNLRTRQLEWRIDDIDPEGNSNVRPPTIYQDKVYFMGQRTIYCVSADSGKHIWHKQYPLDQWGAYADHFMGNMSLPVMDGMLISHPDKKTLQALNPQTGAEIWSQHGPEFSEDPKAPGADPYELIRYKDYIIYSSQGQGGVFIHSLSNGELITRLRSPSRKQSNNRDFTTAIAVDQELGHLYVCDGWFWYCYKLKL